MEKQEHLKKSQANRYYPIDDNTCNILKQKNVKDFLDWSNLLIDKNDREKICNYISSYLHDIKKLNKIGGA